jgi:ubiquinone/menaquinone biosynthesis C-methylase UbiE
LNIDGRQLAPARQLVKPLAANTVIFCQGDACALPFANESFDHLVAVECVFHFPSREAFFKEVFRVLRPGRVLALSDFIPAHVYLPISRLGTSRWFENYSVFGRCNVQYTVAKCRRLAPQSGLALHAARNITRHTLPTYRYLQLMARNTTAGPTGRVLGSLVRSQEILGRLGLLNYYLLSFSKP